MKVFLHFFWMTSQAFCVRSAHDVCSRHDAGVAGTHLPWCRCCRGAPAMMQVLQGANNCTVTITEIQAKTWDLGNVHNFARHAWKVDEEAAPSRGPERPVTHGVCARDCPPKCRRNYGHGHGCFNAMQSVKVSVSARVTAVHDSVAHDPLERTLRAHCDRPAATTWNLRVPTSGSTLRQWHVVVHPLKWRYANYLTQWHDLIRSTITSQHIHTHTNKIKHEYAKVATSLESHDLMRGNLFTHHT